MKRIFVILGISMCLFVCIFVVYRNFSFPKTASIVPSSSVTPTETPHTPSIQLREVTLRGIPYSFDTYEIEDISKIQLIGNFQEKKTAKHIMEDNDCIFGVNAGFYSTTNTPLGMFVGKNYEKPSHLTSALFNGYVTLTDIAASISSIVPDTYRSIVQTGPMLFKSGEPLPLAINNDTPERRVAAGVTKEGHLQFIVIFIKDSLYQGPLLGDLPKLLEKINDVLDSPIQNAINLDGGSASAFISDTTSIQELTPVGSMFCLTK